MAGVTEAGFVTKRFPEIIDGLRAQAIPLFQDLVQPGEAVDTSDSTLLGRLIGLTTPSLAELWEAMQEVYAAFDPNTSSGNALDNLVAIGGLSRQLASSTTLSAAIWGDTYTEIPVGSLVRTSVGNTQFSAMTTLQLAPSDMIGAGIQIVSVIVGEVYSLTLSSYVGIAEVSTTALVADQPEDVLARLSAALAAYPFYTTNLSGDILYISISEHYSSFNLLLGGELALTKVSKRLGFSAVESGPISVSTNSVTTIVTPVLGWDSVNNPVPAILGTVLESDIELRERFRQSKYLRASNTMDSLHSALLELEGVQEIRLYVNPTDLVDANSLPPHSFMVLVLGGEDTEVGRVIWRHTPLGIASQGAQEVSVITSQGTEQIVKFDRPVYVPLYVEVDLQTYGTEFPVGGEVEIKQALVDYIQSTQTIGGRIVYSRLFDPVNQTPGHEITTLKIGTNPLALAETSISLAYNQIATLGIDDITVLL